MNLSSLSITPGYIAPSAWWQHVPMAHWLVGELQPATIVELGSHYGVSFFAFCEAAEALSERTFVYAIDTWLGDEHAGLYEETVYTKVAVHWEKRHRRRSRLIRSTFDDASTYFENGSVDLLHIDGLHTYDAVRHDYETWLPKMSNDAVILFHDINVRERDFGVWKLWDELKHSNTTYEVLNGHGLGILVLGENLNAKMSSLPSLLGALQSKGELLETIAQLSPEGSVGPPPIEQARADAQQARAEATRYLHELETIERSRLWKLCQRIQATKNALYSLFRHRK
jgi:hypothetical protein